MLQDDKINRNSARLKSFSIILTIFLALFMMGGLTFDKADAMQLSCGQSAILIEATSGRVLYSKNVHQKLPMASTTKIATAITVIENCDIDREIAVDSKAVGVEGSSIYLRKGEKITIKDLLYGLMLRSGNDSAVALAIAVSGSEEDFAILMNNTAKKVGAQNTNFTNPHGLDDKNHYTTAYDLALISAYAMQNETFAEIVNSKKKVISNDGMEYDRELSNKNKLLFSYECANGVKTGYTKRAGRCFVGGAKKDGMQLIAVVLNCGPMFEDSEKMLKYGFENYCMANILPSNKLMGAEFTPVKTSYIGCKGAFSYPLRKNGTESRLIDKRIDVEPTADAPLGKICIYFDNQLIFSQKLVTI